MAARDEVHRPTDEEVWDAVASLIAVFEQAASVAPMLRERMEAAKAVRATGLAWPSMIEPERGAVMINATNDLLDDLVNVGARLRRLVAQGLYAEGMSMEAIAETFGVTRQRVSALVHADADATQAAWTKRRRGSSD